MTVIVVTMMTHEVRVMVVTLRVEDQPVDGGGRTLVVEGEEENR